MICLDILPEKIFILNFVLTKDGVLRTRLHSDSAEYYTDKNTSSHTILFPSSSDYSSSKNILEKNAWKSNNGVSQLMNLRALLSAAVIII
jgi:hypothetical protein